MDIDKAVRNADITNDIKRIQAVLETDIFEPNNRTNPLKQAAFTEIIVCLHDLLQKAKGLKVPITFRDDIPQNILNKAGNPMDITDYVSFIRNAVCHISSKTNTLSKTDKHEIGVTFSIIRGKVGPLFFIEGKTFLESPYEDDFCFVFGNHKLYYHRHILRAYAEAVQNLSPLLSNNGSI